MSAGCSFEGCTVGETGRCALERDPKTCSNRIRAAGVAETHPGSDQIEGTVSKVGTPVLTHPAETPRFPASTTLSPAAVDALMARRYVTVVGILGDPESGKTACLASLYLLVSNAMLEGWSFADSRSLMAFEDIARGARRWNQGRPPEQMTVHTEMADEREPGFLHLRLRRKGEARRVDLALPDLPGEWTKTLIRSGRTDRFEFLKAADVLWLVLDSGALANREQRQGTITRLGQLAGRLRALIGETMPRVIIVLTHRDLQTTGDNILRRLATELAKHGVDAETVAVAPFSENEAIKPGYGLATLIDVTTAVSPANSAFWPITPPKPDQRSFLAFRREQ